MDFPRVTTSLASAGLLIALRVRDTAVITRVTQKFDPERLTAEPPQSIVAQATVFAHWHIAEGRHEDATALLHRAINALMPVKLFGDVWSLPITVARYGAWGDFRAARRIIEARAMLPCARVAEATLSLFDACVAQREGRHRKMSRCAKEAVRRFEALGWHSYVDVAKGLLSTVAEKTSDKENNPLVALLTSREREIAELLREGLTNVEIARRLSISSHTVHTHVASIMARLEIHSRHQLASLLPAKSNF